jgi:hypothetical protein
MTIVEERRRRMIAEHHNILHEQPDVTAGGVLALDLVFVDRE